MQALTTEQAELLLMIYDIEEFRIKYPTRLPVEGIQGILEGSHLMDTERFDEVADRLEYYGYLHKGDELTTDGKQYVELFKEYLEQKEKNPAIEGNIYSLINIDNIGVKLEGNIGNCDVFGESGIRELVKRVIQVTEKWLHKK